ncbi:hypothetical protein BDN67DRAFT_1017853 [Paxillus ammoniavirescens]|nr:hypothetical protein BDN67DRAFT_1017853 [Paxillus ammoniavirescens]
MSRLSLDDPKYALLYLQALCQNPDIKLVLAWPIHKDRSKGSTSQEQLKGMNNRVLGTLDPSRHLHPPPITPIPAPVPDLHLIMDALVAESTAEGKRKVLNGVYPPPRPWKKDDSKDKPARQYEILKKKDKEVPQEAGKSASKSVERPSETPKTQPTKNVPEAKQGHQDSCPKPHDAQELEYNGDDSDAIMEDIEDTGKGHKDPKLRTKSEKNK